MSATIPGRRLEQRQEALRRANEIRSWRAQLKRDLIHGRVDPVAVLAENDDRLATMKVKDLLIAVPGIGRVKANKWLGPFGCRVGDTRRIGSLTTRQRTWLMMALRAHARMSSRYVARYHPLDEERAA